MNRLRWWIVVSAIAGLPLAAGAQQAWSRIGAGYFMAGILAIGTPADVEVGGSTGGGGHGVDASGLVTGGEGHSAFSDGAAGGYGFFNIGYAVLRRERLLVYPLLGIGGGAMARDSDSTVSSALLLNPGVGADLLIPLTPGAGLVVGLRAGYTFSVWSDEWRWSVPCVRLLVGGYGAER